MAVALQNLKPGNERQRPITTTLAWALRDHKSEADYLRRGSAPTGKFRLVVQRLTRSKLELAVSEAQHGARADWLFPGEWCEERIDWFFDGLKLPPDVTEEEKDIGNS